MSGRLVSRLLISLVVALAACSDDAEPAIDAATDARPDGSSPDDARPDATEVDAAVDAAVDARVDAPPDALLIDAPPDALLIDAPPGTCTINGVYVASFEGFELFFSFNAITGAWAAAGTLAELTTDPAIAGMFTFAGTTFTIQDTPPSICGPTQVGQYAVAFTPVTCVFTMTMIVDPCTDRGATLDGGVFTPQ